MHTIQTYIEALLKAYIFTGPSDSTSRDGSTCGRLVSIISWTWGCGYLLGYREGDSGHIWENIVYFELLRQLILKLYKDLMNDCLSPLKFFAVYNKRGGIHSCAKYHNPWQALFGYAGIFRSGHTAVG